MRKTFTNKVNHTKKDWFLVDAKGKTLGRLASEIAIRLRGKHKPEWSPHLDGGDYIVVINANKIAVSGNKAAKKMYYHHSGYVGNLKQTSFAHLITKKPTEPLKIAIKGMLPKGALGRAMLKKLKIFPSSTHHHSAQKPKPLDI